MKSTLSVGSGLGLVAMVWCALAGCSGSSDDGDAGGSENSGSGTVQGDPSSTSAANNTSASGSNSGSGASTGGGASSQANGSTTGQSATSGSSGTSGVGGAPTTGDASASSSTSSDGSAAGGAAGSDGTSSTGSTTGSTNPMISTACTSDLPALAHAVDVSEPTTVVGSGSADSCSFSALNAALSQGGKITFDCGPAPVTVAVTDTLNLLTDTDTVIDGGGSVTLDGGGQVQILRFEDPDWMENDTRVTLQHLRLANGKTTPTEEIPEAPAPCSQGYNDGEGGALFMRNGNLTVIDCLFSNNQAALLGPDTGGGAIYITGSKHGAVIAGSVFTDNSASNAGAVGGLFAELDIYDSLFQNNTATGNGANNNDPSKCSAMNNGQNEVGSGGNGGAVYQDGGSATNIVLCGVEIVDNAAGEGAFGGGVFMTSNDWSGTLTVQDSTITDNTGRSWTQVQEGGVDNVGTAFGVNALSISVENSTLQGLD